MIHCEDSQCPMFERGICKLGFNNRFRVPRNMADTQNNNWGHVMPKLCQIKYKLKGRRGTK